MSPWEAPSQVLCVDGSMSDHTDFVSDSRTLGRDSPSVIAVDSLVRKKRSAKPVWLKVQQPGGQQYARVKRTLATLKLHTVCDEAHCPNVAHCWGKGTATFMILGDTCTRGCRFCAVNSGHPRDPDEMEPERVAQAVMQLGLRYVVLTMVTRDDLLDGGANHMRQTISRLHEYASLRVEVLVSDFQGNQRDIATVLDAEPDVFAHNVEVVHSLTPRVRDRKCSYKQSMQVLQYAKSRGARHTKSGLMVGLGETDQQVRQCLRDLNNAGVDIVTIGQYLQPSEKRLAVQRYVTPEKFQQFAQFGKSIGIRYVASGPLVRSSYQAAEAFAVAKDQGATGNSRIGDGGAGSGGAGSGRVGDGIIGVGSC